MKIIPAIVFAGWVVAAVDASAMSSTTEIAWPGKPVAARADWPEGVLKLLNDPLRTRGWNPWFSEWPNDVDFFAFQVAKTDEINGLLKKLAAIKSPKLRVLLYPDEEARTLAFSTRLAEGNDAAVVFSIGSQERINAWYTRLKEGEPGVRVFGVHRFYEAPEAQPPTLAIHAANKAVDLKSLKIPAGIVVQAAISDLERAKPSREALIKELEEFVARHTEKPAQATPKQPSATAR